MRSLFLLSNKNKNRDTDRQEGMQTQKSNNSKRHFLFSIYVVPKSEKIFNISRLQRIRHTHTHRILRLCLFITGQIKDAKFVFLFFTPTTKAQPRIMNTFRTHDSWVLIIVTIRVIGCCTRKI